MQPALLKKLQEAQLGKNCGRGCVLIYITVSATVMVAKCLKVVGISVYHLAQTVHKVHERIVPVLFQRQAYDQLLVSMSLRMVQELQRLNNTCWLVGPCLAPTSLQRHRVLELLRLEYQVSWCWTMTCIYMLASALHLAENQGPARALCHRLGLLWT